MRISDWSSDVCSSDLDHYLLERMQGHDIAAKARVARTFQNIRLFPKMTVLENLIVAQHNKLMRASGFTLTGLFGWKGYRKAEVEAVEQARYWLEHTRLTDVADEPAGRRPEEHTYEIQSLKRITYD